MEKKRREHHLHFRLTDDENRELEIASYLDGRSKSDLMRRALNFYIHFRAEQNERLSGKKGVEEVDG